MDTCRTLFDEEFPSSLDQMGDVILRALKVLQEQGWVDGSLVFKARLCLEEALVNAIVHGNGGDPSKRVRLVILDEGDACCLRIYDQGGGFRPEQVHLPDAETKNGRGVCLMRHCTEGLRYNAAEGFLEMRMRRAPV